MDRTSGRDIVVCVTGSDGVSLDAVELPAPMVSSLPRARLVSAVAELAFLPTLHQQFKGGNRRRNVKQRTISAAHVFLLVAAWEGFCKQLAEAVVEAVCEQALNSDAVPPRLKARVGQRLKDDPNDVAVWQLADYGWQTEVRRNLEDEGHQMNLSNPVSSNVDTFFDRTLGVRSISSRWTFPDSPPDLCRSALDEAVAVRHEFGHNLPERDVLAKRTGTRFAHLLYGLSFATEQAVLADYRGRVPHLEVEETSMIDVRGVNTAVERRLRTNGPLFEFHQSE